MSPQKTRASSAAAAVAAAAAIAGDPDRGEEALQHVITVVLKQPKDGLLAQALIRGGLNEIFDVLLLNQPDQDALSYLDGETLITPLPIGYKNLLKAMKMYSSYQTTMEEPITNWLHVTKADFDAFHCSDTCFNATKFDVTQTISTPRHDSLSDFKKGIK